ncbi:SDR family oxidoreductase [Photobacterium sanctipauli]|uniref:SDR family oxidoreductase n=1 Tax=Photobacterium sanctipauli TaxID=1342794 RepID=A0A2T3NZW9_9GAMM|nr:SDR family NAD(P)-dependent oxidoreductase [Photobacterium sanctipauli]PSW21807.1 SDR family oxidoreductase [Photobacterium sanctipauli]
MKVLIIGGNGGIGTALVEHYLSSRPKTTVYATYRTHKPHINNAQVNWFKLDASSEADIRTLAERIPPIDILINAIGVLQLAKDQSELGLPSNVNDAPKASELANPEKSVSEFDPNFFNQNLLSNTLPSILLAKHFARHLKAKQNTYFIVLSARIGSIADNRIGGWISYRCSKAALNMAIKTISIEWKYKQPNCCVLAFHPGTTDTNLSKQFQKNVPEGKLFTPQYVATCLADLIDNSSSENTGTFYSYDGKEIPW